MAVPIRFEKFLSILYPLELFFRDIVDLINATRSIAPDELLLVFLFGSIEIKTYNLFFEIDGADWLDLAIINTQNGQFKTWT